MLPFGTAIWYETLGTRRALMGRGESFAEVRSRVRCGIQSGSTFGLTVTVGLKNDRTPEVYRLRGIFEQNRASLSQKLKLPGHFLIRTRGDLIGQTNEDEQHHFSGKAQADQPGEYAADA